jgi:Aspartyl protease
MSFPFNPQQGLLLVQAVLDGPTGTATLRMALDTGATGTLISSAILVAVGYDPSAAPQRIQVTTGSGVEFVPILPVTRLDALGQQRVGFPVLAHTLPPSAAVDGLIGLDFLRGSLLRIDFRQGQIAVT